MVVELQRKFMVIVHFERQDQIERLKGKHWKVKLMFYNINSNKTDFASDHASSEQRYSSQSPVLPDKTN